MMPLYGGRRELLEFDRELLEFDVWRRLLHSVSTEICQTTMNTRNGNHVDPGSMSGDAVGSFPGAGCRASVASEA
ncbi:MAG: hypothetical protein AUJ92_18630 [Armatimonadetes bacterium CG2_30_59_28]|nr:MAG: hypothetical protein AUJ92_18630 [Armatimonadetes bacterium CG2_30_59_28]PIU64736.1 MAG: hypothetical protein COS85_11450 [Armatimonadetes bacterium CG07_land_8_20_14_0_80_59_28]PJB69401.1 MAG: hypothetical protein CO095_10025 [Armatimonadetes bacterium CG_4_9_14_3_um_filter_58_7]